MSVRSRSVLLTLALWFRVWKLCGREWAAPSSFTASRWELRASSVSSRHYHGNHCLHSARCGLAGLLQCYWVLFCVQGASSQVDLETTGWTFTAERVSSSSVDSFLLFFSSWFIKFTYLSPYWFLHTSVTLIWCQSLLQYLLYISVDVTGSPSLSVCLCLSPTG